MKKYKIGYTTGVFDMFHIGHLNILRRAKEQCDFLIVGVSDDDLVYSYKKKHPIVPVEDRMEILSSIRFVDQVVKQTSMDKFKAWEKLKFNVMFHGDDWKGSNLYNEIEEKLKAVNVDTIYLPHTDGISTTIITEIIKRKK